MKRSAPSAAGILGVGSCLPKTMRRNDFWPPEFSRRDEERSKRDLVALGRSSSGAKQVLAPEIEAAQAPYLNDPFKGARQRYVLTDDELASDLEATAGRRAIEAARLPPEAIDAVLVHSLQPDLRHPSNAPAVQDKCGLPKAAAIAVDNGCCSQHVMMSIAEAMIRAGTFRHVLCVSSQVPSRTVEPMNPNSPIFGDGSSAFVMGPVPDGYGVLGQFIRTDGSFRDAIVDAVMVDGRPERAWHKHVGPIRVATFDADRARETGMRQIEFCREAVGAALADAGLTIDEVRLVLGPQTIVWLNGALAGALGVPPERTLDTFAEVANLGSSTFAFNVEASLRAGKLHPGDLVVSYSPGAGLTRAAVAFRWWDGEAAT